MGKPTRFYSRKQEENVSKYLGGTLTPNSGAGSTKKGDILLHDSVLECKTKTNEVSQVIIKKDWITSLRLECMQMGRPYWGLIFDFGNQETKDQYVVISLADFKEYQELKNR